MKLLEAKRIGWFDRVREVCNPNRRLRRVFVELEREVDREATVEGSRRQRRAVEARLEQAIRERHEDADRAERARRRLDEEAMRIAMVGLSPVARSARAAESDPDGRSREPELNRPAGVDERARDAVVLRGLAGPSVAGRVTDRHDRASASGHLAEGGLAALARCPACGLKIAEAEAIVDAAGAARHSACASPPA
ncbi:MAG: hypothetical protein EXR72_06990 [Myxococcales bacterium]|nr:hypothetical protein [Myxococcales bacterium]